MKKIVIIGASGHAVSVANVAIAAGYKVDAFADNRKSGSEMFSIPILDNESGLDQLETSNFAIAIGDNSIRERVLKKILSRYPYAKFPILVHQSAVVSSFSKIGDGTVVMPLAVIGPNCKIGKFCLLNTSSSIDHDGFMSDFSSLAPGAVAGGNVQIGERSAVSIGATIKHGIKIGNDSIVGANSYLNCDLKALVVAFGSPARIQRHRNIGDPYLGYVE